MEKQQRLRRRMTGILTVAHYLMLLPTYLLLRPLLWIIRRMGYGARLFAAFGKKLRQVTGMREAFVGYEARPQDVFVCSYYKSGTNWAMQIAHQIATLGQGDFEHVHDVIPWPDSPKGYALDVRDTTIQASSPTGLRVIKTHLAFNRIPYAPHARYIAVIRDPKDAAVSGYHFARDTMFGPLMPSWADFLAFFMDDDFIFEGWAYFVNSYWQVRDRENVLFLTYEAMKQDLPGTVRQIAHLMGVALTEGQFERVCEKSSFAYMKGIDAKFYPGRLTPWSNPNGKMMRRGKVGTAGELMSPEQKQMMDAHYQAKLQELGCDFPYSQHYGL